MEMNQNKDCKSRLISAIAGSNLDRHVKLLLKALADNLFIIKSLISQKEYLDPLFERIEELIVEIGKENLNVLNMLNELENFDVIEGFLSKFDVLETKVETFLNEEMKSLAQKGILAKLQAAITFLLENDKM